NNLYKNAHNDIFKNFNVQQPQSKTKESEVKSIFDNKVITEEIDDMDTIQNSYDTTSQRSEENIIMMNTNLMVNNDFKEENVTVKINELSSKIVEYIKNIKTDKTLHKSNAVFISIEPENLGKIKFKFLMHDNKVSAELYVSRPITKEIIEAQISDIKKALLQDNIQVSSFNVNLEDRGSKHSFNNYDLSQENRSTQDSRFYKDKEQPNNRQENSGWRYARYTNSRSLVDLFI
ncbi:MAG: flagellar hook-length control protein FliK, partial [bacterium]